MDVERPLNVVGEYLTRSLHTYAGQWGEGAGTDDDRPRQHTFWLFLRAPPLGNVGFMALYLHARIWILCGHGRSEPGKCKRNERRAVIYSAHMLFPGWLSANTSDCKHEQSPVARSWQAEIQSHILKKRIVSTVM